MIKWIAERKLQFTLKGDSSRKELNIRISAPYSVNSDNGDSYSGCTVEFDGLPKALSEEIYGADHIQALQLAVNIEPVLKRVSREYDLYFPTGECYFEPE